MSDHVWTLENLECYVAGGLDVQERSQLERHVAECLDCARALAEARAVDHRLGELFAAVRPDPALEDRFIRRLKREPTRPSVLRPGRPVKLALAAAAVLFLVLLGAGITYLMNEEQLAFPGTGTENRLKQLSAASVELPSQTSSMADQASSMADDEQTRAKEPLQKLYSRKKEVSWGYFYPSKVLKKAVTSESEKVIQPLIDTGGVKSLLKLEERPSNEHQGGQIKGEDKTGEGGRKGKLPAPEETADRKVIRTGEIDFVVDSFDASVVTITRLVRTIKGGYVATLNSDKLPNGKVRGSVVVRVPPERLDSFVLDLRKELGKIGELKGQRLTSEDVSKKYTDYQGRLRSARTMEERLLKIIREGKGQIKDLVMAEEALGKYRKEIEVLEGELRWLANQVALSTLTINLTEKEIRAAAAVKESEKVQASIEVEDVDKARREVENAVLEAKGRLLKSDMKQWLAGQFQALLEFEVAADKAGPLLDHLRQLGTLTRLESERMQQAEDGVLGLKNGKTQRGPTHFTLSLYNLANIEPRETVTLKVAATDVAGLFRKLRTALAKVPSRVAVANLNEQDRQNITAKLDFDVRRKDEADLLAVLKEGTVLTRQTSRAPASEQVTDSKISFVVDLVPASSIPPRETMTLGLRVSDVEGTLTLFKAQVKEVGGRTVQPVLRQDPDGRVTAHALFIVPLSAAPGLFEKFKVAGRVSGQRVDEHTSAPDGKLALAQLDVTLSNMELLVPPNEGFWAQVQHGLSLSFRGLFWSLSWLIVGVLFVLPWVLLIWAVVWLIRRLTRGSTPAPTGG